jgi:hypothetical protein
MQSVERNLKFRDTHTKVVGELADRDPPRRARGR